MVYINGYYMVNDGYLYNMREFVNGKDDIPYMMENKKCLKPPTRLCNDDIYLMSKIIFFDINLSNL